MNPTNHFHLIDPTKHVDPIKPSNPQKHIDPANPIIHSHPNLKRPNFCSVFKKLPLYLATKMVLRSYLF